MRNAFIKCLDQLTYKNKNIIILSGDLGFSVFENFIIKYPQNFYNLGVGEANMTSIAAGMAAEGNIPVLYSIIPFITMRCFEQIRNDICSHNLNVKIIGVGSGLGYAHLGISHHSGEDISIMRTLPNMTVISPADSHEVEAALHWAFKHKGPVYIRLGKSGEPLIHNKKIIFKKNPQGFVLKNGKDGVVFSTGTIIANTLQAVQLLQDKNINFEVVSIPFIKPIDINLIIKSVKKHQHVFTIEEHSVIGGLGSAIAEVLIENSIRIKKFKRFGFNDSFCRTIGNYDYMRDSMGLSAKKIAKRIELELNSLN